MAPKKAQRQVIDPAVRPGLSNHNRLGQVYEATGKRGQAADEYREFLSVFEGSASPLPQIQEARAALKRLGTQ